MPDPLIGLAQRLIDHARRSSLTLATAESCTAGALATLLSRTEGASQGFHGGLITYTKEQKSAAGIPAALIAAHTAVSGEVAGAMVGAALTNSPANIALAITGVAGPEPDEDNNPVGLVFVAAGRRGVRPHTERHMFRGDRDTICRDALRHAIRLAMRLIPDT